MSLLLRFATVALTLVAGPLLGQGITAQLQTGSPYGNFARQGNRQNFVSWPVGMLVPSSGSIAANAGNAFADTIIGWRIRGNVVSVDVSEQGGGPSPLSVGTTPSISANNARQGPHAMRLLIRGMPGLAGKVEVWGGGLARAGSVVTMQADIGDDGSVEFNTAASAIGSFDRSQWTVVLDQNGELPVRITTDAKAVLTAGDTIYKVGISVQFTPGSFCDMITYGTSCGPVLAGSDAIAGQTRRLRLQLASAPAMAPGVLIVGTQTSNLVIPGTSCRLLTDPAIAVPMTTDRFGSAQRLLLVPLGLTVVANFQAGVLGRGGITTSNAVAVNCR